MFYEDVFRALDKSKVKYAVAGGVAVNLHGYVRFTADLDLIVQLERKNISRFFSTIEGIGYIPKGPVTKEQFIDKKTRQEWIRPKSIKVFSFFHSKNCLKVIDILTKEPFVFETIENDFTLIRIADFKIPVLSIKHLIKLKKT